MIIKTADFFVTRAVLDPTKPTEKIVAHLKKRGTTGPVMVKLNQGGTIGIAVDEEIRLTPAEARHIREYLGMNK